MNPDIVVVGAGIVGSAVAAELALRHRVLVLDAGPESLAGSTGHAPGYLGEFGGAQVATELACATTRALEGLAGDSPDIFSRTGCLEIATSAAGAEALAARMEQAREHGLAVEELGPDRAAALAPETVRVDDVAAALHFPKDATAHAPTVTALLRARAEASGARFAWGMRVRHTDERGDRVEVATGDDVPVAAQQVVLCTGIWGEIGMPPHGHPVPIVPVRHPYVYGPQGDPPRGPRPFVRFPEHHVYARRHGAQWGFGTYDHAPDPIDAATLATAELPWDGRFDDPIARGLRLFARPDLFAPARRLDGVFAVTPDNLPLIGSWSARTWMVAAAWVTHAVGAAQVLAALVDELPAPVRDPAAVDPRRFDSWDPVLARESALRRYNDIYERGSTSIP